MPRGTATLNAQSPPAAAPAVAPALFPLRDGNATATLVDAEDGFVRLHPKDREAIAQRVAELLRQPQPTYVKAKTLADRFEVSTDWVYDHAEELGASYIGDKKRKGDRTSMRFNLQRAEAAMAEREAAKVNQQRRIANSRAGRRRKPAVSTESSLRAFAPVVRLAD